MGRRMQRASGIDVTPGDAEKGAFSLYRFVGGGPATEAILGGGSSALSA